MTFKKGRMYEIYEMYKIYEESIKKYEMEGIRVSMVYIIEPKAGS